MSESTLQKSLMDNQTSEELQGVFIRMQVTVKRHVSCQLSHLLTAQIETQQILLGKGIQMEP